MADWVPAARRLLTRLLLGFALISIGFAAGKHAARSASGGGPRADSTDDARSAPPSAVVVYYMHATFRCVTCNTIEKMTRALLAGEFGDELGTGAVRIEAVDFQENEALARHYAVIASCIVVSQVRDGKEVAYQRLDEVWTLMKDPPAFNRYVGDTVRRYLPGGKGDG